MNHTSALRHVDKYVEEELKYGALCGPYDSLPFQVHVSPLMTSGSYNKRRTIVHLSWSKRASVISPIAKKQYLNTYFNLHYPYVDHLSQALGK